MPLILGCIITAIYLTCKSCQIINNRAQLRIKLILLFFVGLVLRMGYDQKFYRSCDNWTKGVQSEMKTLAGECLIEKPQMCLLDTFDLLMDFSISDCSKSAYLPNAFSKYNTQKPFIALHDSRDIRNRSELWSSIYDVAMNRVQGYDTLEEAQKYNEAVIDVKNEKLHQKIIRNESLVEERQQNFKRAGANKNMIVIYIDALSRPRAHLKLPKTMQYFKEQKEVYEFFKYSSLVAFTDDNAQAFSYGIDFDHSDQNKTYQSISAFFKEQGYIIGKSQNQCDRFYYQMNETQELVQPYDPADHEMLSFACDPHYHQIDFPDFAYIGPYSMFRKCLYGQDTFQYVLNFGNDFMQTYDKERKVLFLNFIDYHEGSGTTIKFLDEPLAQFLKQHGKQDTTIIFMSDHGFHMNGPPLMLGKLFGQSQKERLLPLMIISNLGDLKGGGEIYNIQLNQQKLVYHKHLYNFWKYWATKQHYGQSFFSQFDNDYFVCNEIGPNCKCENFLIKEKEDENSNQTQNSK
ncbi:UNKNOWN [Stylonychia lemnae]|uniref:Duf229 domain containing protein n=1 Tax=Stylonychia lemnae TaxID=5949 RepID=A0A078AYM1_STYLE|nr:UNKNOWN [Stylonychia lemnae]|eukprot:CDW87264.1 UNKNOWN [Stylonychia lemnae]